MKKRGMSQTEAAELIGVNKGTFSAVCGGSRVLDPERLIAACDRLDINARDVYPASALRLLYGGTVPERAGKGRLRRRYRVELPMLLYERLRAMGRSVSKRAASIIEEALGPDL